jgi:hypothetical protein
VFFSAWNSSGVKTLIVRGAVVVRGSVLGHQTTPPAPGEQRDKSIGRTISGLPQRPPWHHGGVSEGGDWFCAKEWPLATAATRKTKAVTIALLGGPAAAFDDRLAYQTFLPPRINRDNTCFILFCFVFTINYLRLLRCPRAGPFFTGGSVRQKPNIPDDTLRLNLPASVSCFQSTPAQASPP